MSATDALAKRRRRLPYSFALGGGTYTGIEAVSNNIHMLREPRMVTGRWTMTYMAASLSFAASGLIILYLLWGVHPEFGRTLNAVTFRLILAHYLGSEQVAGTLIMLATLSVARRIRATVVQGR